MAQENKSTKSNEPGVIPASQDIDQWLESGWSHCSNKEYFRAEADFQKVLAQMPDDPDTIYALAMTQQANGQKQESIQNFEKVIQIIQDPSFPDHVRAIMLTRLARGHINRMKTGDWGLDK